MSACGDTGRVKGRICTTRKGDMLRTWGKLCFVGGVNFDGEGSRRLSRPNDPNIPFERPNGYNIPEVISRWIELLSLGSTVITNIASPITIIHGDSINQLWGDCWDISIIFLKYISYNLNIDRIILNNHGI